MAMKPGSLPPIASATATAMSLADLTISILSAVSRVMRVPGLKPILLGGMEWALALTVTTEVLSARPSRMALKAR